MGNKIQNLDDFLESSLSSNGAISSSHRSAKGKRESVDKKTQHKRNDSMNNSNINKLTLSQGAIKLSKKPKENLK